MSKLTVGQKRSYSRHRDAMAEFGYDLWFSMSGAHWLNDSTLVWFPNLTQSKEDIARRGFGNYINGEFYIVEVAADERRLARILRSMDARRIAFPRKKGEDYKFGGLYKYDRTDKSKLSVFWKRIATEIDTDDYPAEPRGRKTPCKQTERRIGK